MFLDALRDHLAQRILATAPDPADRRHQLAARYQASGITGTLTWWLDHGQDPAPAAVARLVQELRPSAGYPAGWSAT